MVTWINNLLKTDFKNVLEMGSGSHYSCIHFFSFFNNFTVILNVDEVWVGFKH